MNAILVLLAVMDGVAYASLVFMVSVGLTLVFGVLRVLNVAHGSFYAIGAYIAVTLFSAIQDGGLPDWTTLLALLAAAIVVAVLLGAPMERLLLRRIYGEEQALQLLVTFAVFMILEDVQRLIWGVQPYFNATPLTLFGDVTVANVTYKAYQVVVLPLVAIATLIGLRLFLRRTLAGRVILAVTEDGEAAASIGIRSDRVYLLTFALGAALAGLGGALAAPTTSVLPGIGADMIVLSFAVAATAGLGRIEGAALTALLIGLGRSFAVYLAPQFEVVVPYLIMVVVLTIRPQGLFGMVEARKI